MIFCLKKKKSCCDAANKTFLHQFMISALRVCKLCSNDYNWSNLYYLFSSKIETLAEKGSLLKDKLLLVVFYFLNLTMQKQFRSAPLMEVCFSINLFFVNEKIAQLQLVIISLCLHVTVSIEVLASGFVTDYQTKAVIPLLMFN